MLLNCGAEGLLRVPWAARRSNQSVLKEINPEYLLQGLMLKLQYMVTWCEEPTHWKRLGCWERLRAGGEGDETEDEMDSITNSMNKSLGKLQETAMDRKPRVRQSVGLQIWTGLNAWATAKAYAAINFPLRTALLHSTDFGKLCFYFIHFEVLFIFDFFMDSVSLSVACWLVSMFFTHFLPVVEY